jgi:hypothetical protein
MHRMHPFDEGRFGGADVAQRLAGDRLGQEAYEIAGMTRLQGVADLAVRLEAADTRTMARPWIDDDEGTLCRIDPHPGLRAGKDTQQHVVAGPFQRSSIQHDFMTEGQDWGFASFGVLDRLIAAFPHDVPEQDRALTSVGHVIYGGAVKGSERG